jgi:N-formylglutamate amidohydrolase
MNDAFSLEGPAEPLSPVLLSVPHAGRHYPEDLKLLARLSVSQLMALEDRHADMMTNRAIEAGHTCLIARVARAWIDLNRSEVDLDPAMIAGGKPPQLGTYLSAKVRGGLGLIPARISSGGGIWAAPLCLSDLETRIETIHRPYHQALADALGDRVARFGSAVLLDVHSMPPLPHSRSGPPPHIVVGNLHGRAASPCFSERILHEAQQVGFRVALNAPYAGGHILERHSAPKEQVHALQLEVDRSLYLCARLKDPGAGLPALQNFILRLADALVEEAGASAMPLAAE